MNDNFNTVNAMLLAEEIDWDLNGEQDRLDCIRDYYNEMIGTHKSEEEVLEGMCEKIEEALCDYFASQYYYADDEYEKEVYSKTSYEAETVDGKVKVTVWCPNSDMGYDIKNGTDVKEACEEAIEDLRKEAERDVEYDD